MQTSDEATEKSKCENVGTTKKLSGEVFLDELLPFAQKDPQISEKYFGRPRNVLEGEYSSLLFSLLKTEIESKVILQTRTILKESSRTFVTRELL